MGQLKFVSPPPPFYKIAVKCCEPMRYSVCVLFAHKKHLNRTVALAGLLPCLFSVLCKVSSHTQRGWGRDQIHKGFLGKVSVCAKAKGGGLFFPLQTSCYIYSKDSAASNSHWRGGGTCTAQMYLFEVFPEPRLNIYPLSAYSFMDEVL